jgi:hypothetical protein
MHYRPKDRLAYGQQYAFWIAFFVFDLLRVRWN